MAPPMLDPNRSVFVSTDFIDQFYPTLIELPVNKPALSNNLRQGKFYPKYIMRFLFSLVLGAHLAFGAVRLQESGEHSCSFQVQVDGFHLLPAPTGNQNRLAISDFWSDARPGYPDLPIRYVFVAVPQGARVDLSWGPGQFQEISDIRLAPVPRLAADPEDGLGKLLYEEDRGAYGSPGFHSSALAELVSVEPLRQLMLARIRISPGQYDPVAKKLRIYKKIEVKVSWDIPGPKGLANADAGYDRVYSALVLNYETARNWVRPALQRPKDGDPFDLSARWFRIPILESGVYVLDHSFLQRSGLDPATIDPRTIKIFNGGSRALPKSHTVPYPDSLIQCAILVTGQEDGRFDPEDVIIFYAQDLSGWHKNTDLTTLQYHNPYCDTNVYWLAWGGLPGLRMATLDGRPQTPGAYVPTSFWDTIHLEQENYNPFNSGEIWYWQRLTRSNTEAVKSYAFALSPLDPVGGEGRLRLSFRAGSEGWHRLRWGLDGQWLRDLRWNGSPASGEVIDTAVIAGAGNRLDIELIKENADTSDEVHFNWCELIYRRGYRAQFRKLSFRVDSVGQERHRVSIVGLNSDSIFIFEISDPQRPRQVIGHQRYPAYLEFEDAWRKGNRYLALAAEALKIPARLEEYQPQRLRASFIDANYLVIVPDELWPQAQRLADLYRDRSDLQPLRLAKLSWIYNEFGFGLRQPAAIRNFLKHIYLASNRTRPNYCLLFGNGNYDYRYLNKSLPNINYIPSYQGDALGIPLGEYRFDANDDWFAHLESLRYPQFAIARLPATSPSEADALMNKIAGYQTSFGPWRARAVFLADDQFTPKTSSEWIHTIDTETLARYYLPRYYDAYKVYGIEYPKVDRTKPGAKADLLKHWSAGSGLVNFTGHGNWWTWGHEEYFRDIDVPYLNNAEKLPFVISASCLISRFDNPKYRCISAALVTKSSGGAIATFGDMREGYSGPNSQLNQELFRAIFNDSLDLGRSVFLAKYRTQSISENNTPYVLLGDPAINLLPRRGAIQWSYLPDTLHGRGRYTLRGKLVSGPGSGQVLVKVFDLARRVDSSGVSYYHQEKVINQGLATVTGDSFVYTFNVPDLYYALPQAGCRISAYAWNANGDAAGVNTDTVWLGGLDTSRANDNQGPAISLWAEGMMLRDGDFVSQNAKLSIRVSDPLGINLNPGTPEGEIRVWLDNEPYRDLSQNFVYDLDSDTSGTAEYAPRLAAGSHLLTVRAYDCFGNYTTLKQSFRVAETNSSLEMIYNYPNPTSGGTWFTFQLPEAADVSIKIFTVSGRNIRNIEARGLRPGYQQIYWDGLDRSGDRLANGVYLYKITMNGQTHQDSQFNKIVIMR